MGKSLAFVVDFDLVMYTFGGECSLNWPPVMCVL
jgi:hypothetical protein